MTIGWPWPSLPHCQIWFLMLLYGEKLLESHLMEDTCSKWPKVYVKIKILTPGGCLPLPRGYIHVQKQAKICIKSDFKDIFLKLATNGQSDKTFLLTSEFCPQRAGCPCPGLYTCGKTFKTCIKSEFKEICLKLATNGRSGKGFLLTSKLCPQGVFCPCPEAVYMYKIIKHVCKIRFWRDHFETYGQREKAFRLS